MSVVVISFAAYTLAIVLLGLYSARYSKRSDEDFFLAGRSLGPWVAALSASASSESGWVTLGLVGWAFANGVQAYWIIPGCLLGYLFNWFVIAGRLSDRSRAVGALTLPDFFAFSFRERVPLLRVLSVIVILVAMVLYVAAQFAAAGKAFAATFTEGTFNITYHQGVWIGAGIVLIYTVSGGFRAVCWTDFLQALLMVGTLAVFPIYLLIVHGGYGFVTALLAPVVPGSGQAGDLLRFFPDLAAPAFLGFLLGSGALGINFGYPGQPHVLVRFMALHDKKAARVAGIVAVVWGFFVYWGAVTIGLFARAMTEEHDAWTAKLFDGELSLVVAAINLLPGVLSGMVLAAVLAAICSTADSQLVVAASSAANDLYARLCKKSEAGAHPWLNRVVVAALGLIAVWLVYDQQVQVYKYVLDYGWAILGASFGPQVILLLLWKRASYAGCLAGMVTGFAVALLWRHFLGNELAGVHVYNLPLAFLAALVINAVVSVIVPGRSRPAA
jgi:sodium/proline symporter